LISRTAGLAYPHPDCIPHPAVRVEASDSDIRGYRRYLMSAPDKPVRTLSPQCPRPNEGSLQILARPWPPSCACFKKTPGLRESILLVRQRIPASEYLPRRESVGRVQATDPAIKKINLWRARPVKITAVEPRHYAFVSCSRQADTGSSRVPIWRELGRQPMPRWAGLPAPALSRIEPLRLTAMKIVLAGAFIGA